MDATAPRRIRLLPPELANQIAAGEVVERPASVLKELLENSIDAGARHIEVETERGGVGLIRVRDDGDGIYREDLALALSPHATSKVTGADDLEHLISLGFRGEALASIASVSRLAITSRRPESEQGWRVAGPRGAPEPAAHPPGTSVEVRDLFYNTPGRRKFLRAENTEFGHLEQVFRRLALSRFGIGFSLSRNRRQLLRVKPVREGESAERRIAEVTGRVFLKGAASVDFAVAGLQLWGWVAGPDATRSQADLQYFYVNHRLIRDRLIAHALRRAYQDLLPEGRHPAYVLYLELDPSQVDVNVHPTKHEVRFREARMVHDFLYRGVRDALQPSLTMALPEREPAGAAYPRTALRPAGPVAVQEQMTGYAMLVQGHRAAPPPRAANTGSSRLGRLALVAFERYLLTEHGEGPRLIDAEAAREALALRRLQTDWQGEGIRSQPLLVPESLTVEPAAVARAEQQSERLSRLGFDISPLGEGVLMMRQVPAPLRRVRPAPLTRALLDALGRGDNDLDLLRALARCAGSDTDRPLDRTAAEELLLDLEPVAAELSACWVCLTRQALERFLVAGTA